MTKDVTGSFSINGNVRAAGCISDQQTERYGNGMITSTSNPRVRQLAVWQEKARKRREDGVFLAEGIKMLREAPKEWLKEVYLTEEVWQRLQKEDKEVFTKIEHTGYELLSDEVMKKVSDTQTPQGALSVLKRPSYTIEDIVGKGEGTFLVLENLQDPGNLGTIIRTGEGAGIRGVIMSQDTVDIYNPKTIRATMGSVYRVPFIYVESLSNIICYLKEKGVRTYAAHLKGTKHYYEFSYTGGTAFLIGNEGNGLKKETADLADDYLRIPMEGQVESLNAAIAAAILMYEAYRQRKQ